MYKTWTMTMLLLMALTALLTSCNEYEVRGETVYYKYWTFSFGHQETELEGADAETFQSLKNWLGRDQRNVWYKSQLISEADPASVVADDYPLFHDHRDYYYKGSPLNVADMASMRILKSDNEELWGADNRYIYFDTIRIDGGDPATLELLSMYVAKDSRHVYYRDSIMADADPETFKTLGWFSSAYSKDKNHVWFCDKQVEGADVETFKVKWWPKNDGPDAEDKNWKYYWGERYNEDSENK